jgi:hypothetical protein
MLPPALTIELPLMGESTGPSAGCHPIPSHYIGRRGLGLPFLVG